MAHDAHEIISFLLYIKVKRGQMVLTNVVSVNRTAAYITYQIIYIFNELLY